MTSTEKITKYIEEDRRELTHIVSGLIKIHSISGRPYSNQQYEKISDYPIEEFRKFGVRAKKYALAL